MIDILILLILFIGAYSGYKKGVVLQLLQTIGYLVVMIFALDYYRQLSEYLFLLVPYPTPFAPDTNPYPFYNEQFIFSMDMSYYHIISFIAIFLVGWVVVKFFIKLISYTLERLRAPEPISGIGGTILGVLVNYVGVFFLLILLTTIPYDFIQSRLVNSPLASTMITSTPGLSDRTYQRFFVDVNEEAMQNRPTMDLQLPEETNEETQE